MAIGETNKRIESTVCVSLCRQPTIQSNNHRLRFSRRPQIVVAVNRVMK